MARFRHRISAPAVLPGRKRFYFIFTSYEERGKTRNPTGEFRVSRDKKTQKLPCWSSPEKERKEGNYRSTLLLPLLINAPDVRRVEAEIPKTHAAGAKELPGNYPKTLPHTYDWETHGMRGGKSKGIANSPDLRAGCGASVSLKHPTPSPDLGRWDTNRRKNTHIRA